MKNGHDIPEYTVAENWRTELTKLTETNGI